MPLKIWSLLASASIALPSITVLFSALLLPFLAGPGRLRAAGWCWWLGTRRGAGVRGHWACGAGVGASQERRDGDFAHALLARSEPRAPRDAAFPAAKSWHRAAAPLEP